MKDHTKVFKSGLLLVCFFTFYTQAFSQYVIIHEGVPVKLSNKGTLNFSNGTSLTNNSSMCAFNGTFMFSGSKEQSIEGSQKLVVANLTVNNSNLVNLFLDVEVANQLVLNSGVVNLIQKSLYLRENALINGSFNENSMIAADSTGSLFKMIKSTGYYFLPVGDLYDGADYSPLSLNFKSGNFSRAYVKINLKNRKHPKNASQTDFIKRYWSVWSKGISGFLCEVRFNYVIDDIVGNEENVYGAYWNMTKWSMLNKSIDHSIFGNVSLLSDFTGAERNTFSTTKTQTNFVNIFVNENGLHLQALDNIMINKVEIYNKMGQMVFSKSIQSSDNFDLAINLNPDLYLIKIQTNVNSFSNKIFIP